MLLGPVFWMEMRTRARRLRLYAARSLFVSALCVVLAFVMFNDLTVARVFSEALSIQDLAKIGYTLFATYASTQFAIIVFFTPVYCGGAIAGDRERRVLDLVFTTRLNNLELVSAKFFVRWLDILALAAAGLPVLFLCLLFGGVSWQMILAVFMLTVVTTGFAASLTLLVSIFARRIVTAVTVSYIMLVLLWMALPILASLRHTGTGPPPPSAVFFMAIHPAVAMALALGAPLPIGSASPFLFAAAYGAATAVLLILDVAIVRRIGLWASRERPPKPRKGRRDRPARDVWNNPVAWREVKTITVHRRMRWPRLLTPILLVMIGAPLWVSWLADWLGGYAAQTVDTEPTAWCLGAMACISWTLMALQGSVCFSHESDHSTLDALLTTPLSGAYIAWGKIAGVLRSSAFAIVLPLLVVALAVFHGAISWRAGALGAVVLVVGSLLATAWGLHCSVRNRTSVRAMSKAAGAMLAIGAGFALGIEILMAATNNWTWLTLALASPTVNLGYALYEPANMIDPWQSWGISRNWQDWSERLTATGVYLIVYAVLTVVLIRSSILWIDRHYRIGVWHRPLTTDDAQTVK